MNPERSHPSDWPFRCWLSDKGEHLPHPTEEVSGLYAVMGRDRHIYYIGKSENIGRRWAGTSHHRHDQAEAELMGDAILSWCPMPEHRIHAAEKRLIDHYQPDWNGTRTKTYTRVTIPVRNDYQMLEHTHQRGHQPRYSDQAVKGGVWGLIAAAAAVIGFVLILPSGDPAPIVEAPAVAVDHDALKAVRIQTVDRQNIPVYTSDGTKTAQTIAHGTPVQLVGSPNRKGLQTIKLVVDAPTGEQKTQMIWVKALDFKARPAQTNE